MGTKNIGLFEKDVDTKISTPWQTFKTWWFDTTTGAIKVWNGSAWVVITVGSSSLLLYNIAAFKPGKPTNSEVVLLHPVTDAFTLASGASGSYGRSLVASTGSVTYDLAKNAVSFGTMNFAAAASTATFTVASPVSFVASDYVTVTAPVTADASLSGVSFTLRGVR